MKLGNRRINWRRFTWILLFIVIIFIGYNRVEALIAAGGQRLTAEAPASSQSPELTPDTKPSITPTPKPDTSPDTTPNPDNDSDSSPDKDKDPNENTDLGEDDNQQPELELPDPPEDSASESTYQPNNPADSTGPLPDSSEVEQTDGGNTDDAQQGNERGEEQLKKVALTFDDGPDERWTPQVLDILREYDVEATFFTVGTQAERFPDMLPVILDEGHELANHTWTHKKLTEITREEILQEIRLMSSFLEQQVGEVSSLFRAPYGSLSDPVRSLIADEGLSIVGWTVDTRDWEGTEPSVMLETVKKQLSPDGIILMHSFGGKNGDLSNTIEFLPILIEYLVEEGYTLVKASDI